MAFEFIGLEQYADIILAIIYFLGSLIIAKIVNFVVKHYVSRATQKTKTQLDDMLLHSITKLILIGFILYGLLLALQTANIFNPYTTLINQTFTVIFGLYGAFFVIKIINTFIDWYGNEILSKKNGSSVEQFIPVVRKVIFIVIGFLALTWILGQLGIQITTLVATLGIGGLAVALALQSTLSNFFSGAYVMMDRPIKIGDYIELESGDAGYVKEIGWRTTKIRTWQNNLIIIPNDKIASGKLINYNSPQQSILFKVDCGIGYNEDLENVERITIQEAKKAIKKTSKGVEGFDPIVRFKEFGDSNINFVVIFKVKAREDQFLLKHEFIKNLKKRFDKEGIEIAWPIRKIYFDEKQFKKLTKK